MTLITILIIILLIPVSFFILGVKSRTGTAPGLVHSKLTRCPEKPNCVCSEFDNDPHYVKPIDLGTLDLNSASDRLKDIIVKMGGTLSAGDTANYIAASFSSSIFGFVDDLEIRLDATAGVAQIRSASRVGHGDLGVNNKRVEALRKLFEQR